MNVGQLELADEKLLAKALKVLYGPPDSLPDTIDLTPSALCCIMKSIEAWWVNSNKHERIQLHFLIWNEATSRLSGRPLRWRGGREQAIPTENLKTSLVKASLEGDVLSLLIPEQLNNLALGSEGMG